ncbi:MAG: hypothetical protein HOE48_15385 [Candidatus Latescibacteria bacterium]|nr:hypothetical protein [Candidatus Latescibacterota bacterium]MBT4139303.1 hypothetical protein [Candidatus Latescibacterota bacterium]MBT5832313.1 hypothetical protein [Candidatus Latescibacterota bacterium]
MKQDLAYFLSDWTFDPTDICARKIIGLDGREKLQVRLDLGVLQMEVVGRPDGERPHGHASVLDYYLDQLEAHRAKGESDDTFFLDADACGDLGQECLLFYHRYICLLRLCEFDGVVRDTTHYLAILDLVQAYAEDEEDRISFQQYRPYVLMISTRAKGEICLLTDDYQGALKRIEEGMAKIRATIEMGEEVDGEEELQALSAWAEELDREQPRSLLQQLTLDLQSAIAEERYEQAAKLRDQLRDLDHRHS